MTAHPDFSSDRDPTMEQDAPSLNVTPQDVTPPVGETPPQVLAQDAAEGHRGAAWRLMLWILKNDPRAVIAVSSLDDDRLAQNLLEFIAMGTWAGKPFVVPLPLRSAFARTRLRTLFLPGSGIGAVRAMRVLVPALHDQRPAMRENAVHILGLIGHSSEMPFVVEALQDPVTTVRYQAAKALGRIGDASAVPALINALKSADEQLGSQIFLSLVQIGSPAVPALIEASSSPSAWTRWHCLRALGEINDSRCIPTVARGLTDPDHGVAWMAAKELVGFGKLSIKPVLRQLIISETSPWVAESASYVLHTIYQRYDKYRPYLEPVVQEMHDVGYRVATSPAARKALDQLEADNLLPSPLR